MWSSARLRGSCLVAASLLLGGIAAAAADDPNDPLSILGVTPTSGATSGYLDDAVCGRCHAGIAATFEEVGMAQAFRAPRNARRIEDFGTEYFHAPSDRYYRIDQDPEGALTFVRYQRDRRGAEVNRIDIAVDWVLGSGNRARSYLYQTEFGEVFMLPISWYSEAGAWRMSPGFEDATHQGIGRKVTRACLFCHNAYPDMPEGADDVLAPQRFPHSLPEGIGCQRCHGPGADHVRTVLRGGEISAVRAAIVNPAKLGAAERDSVCFQCHLLPAETVEGVRRPGRGAWSFRPGERLVDYLVNVDISEAGRADGERFEINHHGFRLSQSACFRQSGGQLACITCHDPHVKPGSRELRRSASAACEGCHDDAATLHRPGIDPAGDCVACHMPTRRTDDVVEVTMTDHRIARGPFDHEALTAPKAKEQHIVQAVRVFDPGDTLAPSERRFFESLAAIRANRLVGEAKDQLAAHIRTHADTRDLPLIEFARASLATGDYQSAERTMRDITRDDASATAFGLLGMALLGQGKTTTAVGALSRSAELQPDPETDFNLAAAQLARGDVAGAGLNIDRAIEKRPLMRVAWKYRARMLEAGGDTDGALAAYLRALQIEPADVTLFADVARLYRAKGDDQEAARFQALLHRNSARDSMQ